MPLAVHALGIGEHLIGQGKAAAGAGVDDSEQMLELGFSDPPLQLHDRSQRGLENLVEVLGYSIGK